MSTGAIIAIIVIAIVVIALVAVAVPRSRARSRERQVARRRQEVAGAHREVAEERLADADRAEREARAKRAEAELHESRAALHEEGLADEDLATEHQRFVRDGDGRDANGSRDRDADDLRDRDEVARGERQQPPAPQGRMALRRRHPTSKCHPSSEPVRIAGPGASGRRANTQVNTSAPSVVGGVGLEQDCDSCNDSA